jgi:CheY-like chemotaxis protein
MSKVMLIDDDIVVVDLLATLLTMEGFDVVSQSVEEEIIPSIQKHKPDVILMDVYLNTSQFDGEDGLILLSQIRRNPDISNTRVIMCSGIDFDEESQTAGADGFLLKPYMPEELIKLIRKFG